VLTILAAAVLGYFLGSIPAGYIAGRIAGLDIRTVGSGNIGATNVTRTLGKRFGYPVFAFDFAKGLAAIILSRLIANQGDAASANLVDLCAATAGGAAVLGHSYSIWLGLRGGKGVATSIGVLFGVAWPAALIVCASWILVFQISRYVSLASIVAAITLPITTTALFLMERLKTPILIYFSFFLMLIVVLRHRSNLSRLLDRTEPRFERK